LKTILIFMLQKIRAAATAVSPPQKWTTSPHHITRNEIRWNLWLMKNFLQNSATSTTQIFRNNQNYWFVQITHFSPLPHYPKFNSEPIIVVRYMLYIDYPSVRAQYFLEYCFSSRMWQFWSESWDRARIKIVVFCCSSIFVCRFCVWMNVHRVAKKVGSSIYSLALADIPHF